MADLERTVQIIFEAVDSLTGPLLDMSSSLSGFGDSAEIAAVEATGLGESITSVPTELDIDVEVIGDYANDIEAIEESVSTLTDMETIQIDVDAGTAIGDVETLSNEVESLPDDVSISMEFEDNNLGREIQSKIDLLEEKRLAVASGEGLIKIDSTGLEPALDMLMWQVVEKVQLKANADGNAFLLGVA